MEKKEDLYSVDGNINWCSNYEKQYGGFPQKIKIELPYHPAIQLLGIYSKVTKSASQRDISTDMFTAALFTIAKIWKSTNKCIKM